MIFFAIVFSTGSFSNPMIAVFESSVSDYLMANGVAESVAQQDSQNLAKGVFSDQIKADIQSERYGFSEDSPYFKASFDKETSRNIEFNKFSQAVNDSMTNVHRKSDGVIFHVMDARNWQDKEQLRRMYKEQGFDIVFKTTVRYAELSDYVKEQQGTRWAIAPLWYQQSGMFMYRTKLPVNSSQDYFYANSPFDFYKMGLETGLIAVSPDLKEVEVQLLDNDGEKRPARIYWEALNFYDDIKDAILSAENPYDRNYTLQYLAEKEIHDFSGNKEYNNSIKRALADCDDAPYACFSDNVDSDAITATEEYQGTLLLYKDRDDILTEEDTLEHKHDDGLVDEDDEVPLFEDIVNELQSPSEKTLERLDRFEVKPESLANIYTNEIKYALRKSQSPALSQLSPQSKSLLDSSFGLNANHVIAGSRASGLSSNGGTGISMNDISKPVHTFTSYFDKPTSTGKHIVIPNNRAVADGKSEERKPPVTGTNTEGTGTTNGGTNTAGTSTQGGATTGSNVGANSSTGAGVSGRVGEISNTRTETVTISGTTAETKEDEADDLPTIPIVSDILKPLIDWRASLLSALSINPISGTCPVISISIYDSSFNVDSHCQVFEKIAGLISAIMIFVWSFLTFRVLFSA